MIHVLDSFTWKRTALKNTDLDAGRFKSPLCDLKLEKFQSEREQFLPMVGLTPRLLKKLGPLLKAHPNSKATCFRLPEIVDKVLNAGGLHFEPTKEKGELAFDPVSYTHLTLPTICSV